MRATFKDCKLEGFLSLIERDDLKDHIVVVKGALDQTLLALLTASTQAALDYIDIIRAIRDVKGLHTPIVRIPYGLVQHIVAAVCAVWQQAAVYLQPIADGIKEAFCHLVSSKCVVARPD